MFVFSSIFLRPIRERQTDRHGGGIETDRQTETETDRQTETERQRDRKVGVTERTVFPHAGVL